HRAPRDRRARVVAIKWLARARDGGTAGEAGGPPAGASRLSGRGDRARPSRARSSGLRTSVSPIAEDVMERALAELDAGRAIVFPTDTVYGIACRLEADAVRALIALKHRPGT